VISSVIAIGHTLEAILGNTLTRKWIQDEYPFRNARSAFRFLFVTLLMCAVGSLLGTGSLYFTQVLPASEVLSNGFFWWVGNVVGILLFTPFILSVFRRQQVTFSLDKALEISVFVLGLIGIVFLLRIEYLSSTIERALPFLVLPFLLWLAFRFELLVAISGVLVVSLASIYLTVHALGPFVLSEPYNSMLLLQIFIGVASISTIILSATVRERIAAQHELEQFNETLEARVEARTKELNEEINTRKVAEQRLQQTNAELSKRNTELDNFVYSVSHDLRAPIASVLGLINIARKDKSTEMRDTYLEMINNSALQQDHFIKEILDQSRNSRLELKREEIEFEPLINETFNQLKYATSTGKSVEKVISVHQNQPFFSDRWRLKVILNNIISNAIRYRNGKDPVIKVDVDIVDHRARVSVQDNGKGIAREHLQNVFKMFYRATDDGAGSGLGLYIVKEAIDKLSGKIQIDSEEGKGTTVHIEIPELG
jgi:signal transduction histidine kinase